MAVPSCPLRLRGRGSPGASLVSNEGRPRRHDAANISDAEVEAADTRPESRVEIRHRQLSLEQAGKHGFR